MKYEIRKRENATIYMATDPVTLDDEKFRGLEDDPYIGNSEEEFLKYIVDLIESQNIPYDLDFHEADILQEIIEEERELKSFGSSSEKGSEQWFELGESDEKYRKNGGFNTKVSTLDLDSL